MIWIIYEIFDLQSVIGRREGMEIVNVLHI